MNLTKYSTEAKAVIELTPAPYSGVVYDIVEYDSHIGLRFYRDNLNRYPDHAQVLIAEWIVKLVKALNNVTPAAFEVSDAI